MVQSVRSCCISASPTPFVIFGSVTVSFLKGFMSDFTVRKNTPTKRKYIICQRAKSWHVNSFGPRNPCGAKLSINRLQYIQTHWYVRPYSCTGGAYWTAGEGAFICPECGFRNRLLCRNEDEIRRLEIDGSGRPSWEVIKQFASTVDEYFEQFDPPRNQVREILPV